jgi:hypothetical protein
MIIIIIIIITIHTLRKVFIKIITLQIMLLNMGVKLGLS